jgi:hypothetical protein
MVLTISSRRSLSIDQRKSYIKAVKCMMSTESKYKEHFSVNRNRYDDFVALHANSTGGGLRLDGFRGWEELTEWSTMLKVAANMRNGIHGTGAFLPCTEYHWV